MKYTYIYLLTIILAITSCNEWLDVSPATEIKVDDFYQDEQGFIDALAGCYLEMSSANIYGNELMFGAIEYLAQHFVDDFSTTSSSMDFFNYDYTSSTTTTSFNSMFSQLYTVSMLTNLLLENLDGTKGEVVEERTYKIIKGEALAIRAYCHFDVLRLFGQMPSNPKKTVSLPYQEEYTIDYIPYYTYDEYVEKLERDITESIELLSESDYVLESTISDSDYGALAIYDGHQLSGTRRIHLNYWAVKGLAARFYNYIGETELAYNEAMDIINSDINGEKAVELAGNSDLTEGYYSFPSEGLFLINCDPETLADFYVSTYEGNSITSSSMSTIFGSRAATNNRREIWGQDYPYSWYPYILMKYAVNVVDTNTTLRKTIWNYSTPGIRLSEIYLIAMENTTSLTELNTLYNDYMIARNEPSVAEFTSLAEFQNEATITDEYRVEFFGEGQMFFTYKRLGSTNIWLYDSSKVDDDEYVIPLPGTEINPANL